MDKVWMEKEVRDGRELRIQSEVGRHKTVLRKSDMICLKILENQAGCSAEKGLLACSLRLRDRLRNMLPPLSQTWHWMSYSTGERPSELARLGTVSFLALLPTLRCGFLINQLHTLLRTVWTQSPLEKGHFPGCREEGREWLIAHRAMDWLHPPASSITL